MLLNRFCEDQDVYNYQAIANKFLKDVIHHCLESGWTVSETKEHNQ